MPDEDMEKDGVHSYHEKIHYRENLKRTGYVIFTVRFYGHIAMHISNKWLFYMYSVIEGFVVI